MTDDDYDPTIPPEPDAAPAPAPAVVDDEAGVPAAPATAKTDDLREAVGVARREKPAKAAPAAKAPPAAKAAPTRADDDDDDDGDGDDDADGPPKKRGRAPLVAAIALIVGGTIATFVLLGRSNSGRWVFHCGDSRITAERGRSFPPWGTSRLGGGAWRPIEIEPGAECRTRETGSRAELEGWYLTALEEQAEAKLGAKEVTDVDAAEQELEQALLFARDPDRGDEHKRIDRLLGDVEYWRATARVKAAIQTLEEAGHRFDTASDKRPRYVSDAASWAAWVRQVAGSLRAGPSGRAPAPVVDTGPEPHRDVPTGVALPVEEAPPDAGVAPAPPVDAGVPRGGVLL